MGTSCNIQINNNFYYKHYDGWNGGIALNILDSIVDNEICLVSFIKNAGLETIDKSQVSDCLPMFRVSKDFVNDTNMKLFLNDGIRSIVRGEQAIYDSIKKDDEKTKYFDELRGDSPEKTLSRMRLPKIFKERPSEKTHQEKFDLIQGLTQ